MLNKKLQMHYIYQGTKGLCCKEGSFFFFLAAALAGRMHAYPDRHSPRLWHTTDHGRPLYPRRLFNCCCIAFTVAAVALAWGGVLAVCCSLGAVSLLALHHCCSEQRHLASMHLQSSQEAFPREVGPSLEKQQLSFHLTCSSTSWMAR